MIEKLLDWPVKNKNLARLCKKVEDINLEFATLDGGLEEGIDEGMANMYRARSLLKKISNLLTTVERTHPRDRYDLLVREEFLDSLFAQKEYIQFFFTKRYNTKWGVKTFFDYAFLPEKEAKKGKGLAIDFLENKLRNINYKELTKREDLMRDVEYRELSLNPPDFETMVLEQLPRFRRLIATYNLEMGFETKEQIEDQEKIERAKKFTIGSKEPRTAKNLTKLIYDLVFTYGDYCSFDDSTRNIELTVNRFYFYRDKEGKIRFYSGDIDRSLGHENYHRLQSYLSRNMPAGLRNAPGEMNITGRTILEGVPTVLEDNFMSWLAKEKNRTEFGLSKKDIEIAKRFNTLISGNRLIRLCHSIYHRELSSAEGKEGDEDYNAHEKLAEVSKVPVHADDDYLTDESLPETFYFSFYQFGEDYVRKTLAELEKRETKRLGSKKEAKSFLERNEPLVIQGLLTGNWGWSTHKKFFLSHYWPKARKYCK